MLTVRPSSTNIDSRSFPEANMKFQTSYIPTLILYLRYCAFSSTFLFSFFYCVKRKPICIISHLGEVVALKRYRVRFRFSAEQEIRYRKKVKQYIRLRCARYHEFFDVKLFSLYLVFYGRAVKYVRTKIVA